MKPLEIGPGVVSTATVASYSTAWSETNLVRWNKKKMQPLGGWQKVAYENLLSRAKRIHTWTDNAGLKYLAILCEGHVYVDIAGELVDISPTPPLEAPYDDVSAGGFGSSTFGTGDFGDPRPDVENTRPVTPSYSIDNYGEQLLVMTSTDGRLLYWDPQTPTEPLVEVPNAPAGRLFVVTPERHVIVFGPDGVSASYKWCDQEDITEWTPDTLTSAGDLPIEPAATVVSAKVTKDGIVFITTISSYLISYKGAPFYYGHDKLEDAVTPFSAASIASADADAMWPSEAGFWKYEAGTVSPVACPIWEWIEENINKLYARYEACSIDVSTKGEYWWFFPAAGERYNSRYVVFNYLDNWWAMGKMARSAGVSSAFDSFPIMANGVEVFKHEVGFAYPGVTELPWAETYVINAESGAFMGTFDQMLPDIEGAVDDIRFSLYRRDDRSKAPEVHTPEVSVRSNGYVDFRQTGRDFRLRIASFIANIDWTLGQHQVEFKKRGKR